MSRTPAMFFGLPTVTSLPMRTTPRMTWMVPALRSTSLRRSSEASPNLRPHHAPMSTSARYCAGILSSSTSSSPRVAGSIDRTRLADPAPRIRQGFEARISSVTAVDRIDRSRLWVCARWVGRLESKPLCHVLTTGGVISRRDTSPKAGRMKRSRSRRYSAVRCEGVGWGRTVLARGCAAVWPWVGCAGGWGLRRGPERWRRRPAPVG